MYNILRKIKLKESELLLSRPDKKKLIGHKNIKYK